MGKERLEVERNKKKAGLGNSLPEEEGGLRYRFKESFPLSISVVRLAALLFVW